MDRTRLFRLLCVPFVWAAVAAPLLAGVVALLFRSEQSRGLWPVLAGVAVLGTAFAYIASAWVAGRLRREMLAIQRAFEDMVAKPTSGDSSRRVAPVSVLELDALADRINELVEDRETRLREALARLTEQEAVLTSMVEGVLAVDTEHRLLNVNPAAARIFGLNSAAARGRDLLEVVRNTDLRNFIADALQSKGTVEGEVVIFDPGERFLRAHGSPLRDERGKNFGAVIVLNDVSALRRLENVRRDFVANVSHELKTPITSIKGFVETLQGGAINNSEEAERFLEIIARQADRLNAIIEDLLNLSRIERDSEAGDIALEEGRMRPVLQAALQVCEVNASAKNVTFELECDPSLTAPISAPLLEQALVNLVDNAVKYSPVGGRVRVETRHDGDGTTIRVQDWGVGIEEKHLPRLFERFYRVDKARSRKLGGTGLGLAIVKHIAQAHGGQVTVESEVGRGSIFSLHLPKSMPLPKVAQG